MKMEVIQTRKETLARLERLKAEGKTIGFVPTMGALHEGHLSLVKRSKAENDITVVSIFVNPIQFNNNSDLENYPRTFETDSQLLESMGTDIIFAPNADEMYPDAPSEKYDFGALETVMEGEFRPGHFNGVAVVVKRLFDICIPHKAYFGMKDFQQLAIIKALVRQKDIPVQIIACPTVREEDGLAMSSRNTRLTEKQRQQSTVISKALFSASHKHSSTTIDALKKEMTDEINACSELKTEYIEFVDENTLIPVSSWDTSSKVVACIAVWAGEVRLIDNLPIN